MKPEDINVERRLIRIKEAKGRKDRYTMLSDVIIEILKEYREKYKPEKWLFRGNSLFEKERGGGVKG